jgi:tetraacyldisaccharide 4'-kinase
MLEDAVPGGPPDPAEEAHAFGGGRPMWRARRRQETARFADAAGTRLAPSSGPVVALAGIAHPAGFFRDLARAGWTIARELPYRDHHSFTAADVARIVEAVRAAGARAVLTTEKDLIRLLPFRPFAVPVAYVPMTLEIDPAEELDEWLARRIERARQEAPRHVR